VRSCSHSGQYSWRSATSDGRGRGPAGGVLDVLHEDWDAGEEAGGLAFLDPIVYLRRLPACAVGVEHRERVQLRAGDRFERRLDGVGGLHFAAPDRVG